MTARSGRLALWYFLFVVFLVAVAYGLTRAGNTAFLDGAVGNLLATLFGIVAGVPIALELEASQRREAGAESARQEAESARDTLTLLLSELEGCQARIREREAMGNDFPIDPLPDARWHVLRSAGMLRSIKSPELLAALADSYRLVEAIAGLERRITTMVFGVNVTFPDGETGSMKLLANAKRFHAPAAAQLERTILLVRIEVQRLAGGAKSSRA